MTLDPNEPGRVSASALTPEQQHDLMLRALGAWRPSVELNHANAEIVRLREALAETQRALDAERAKWCARCGGLVAWRQCCCPTPTTSEKEG